MDNNSDISADLLASTPIEKCSLNPRRSRNSEGPKRQLLTGYIIYASEIRKEVVDKNPNQNFGDISRLVGNEWKALPYEIRSKYDQRALIHNKRVRERAQMERITGVTNGLHTPKLTKKKLAKLEKERLAQRHSLPASNDESSTQSANLQHSSPIVPNSSNSNSKSLNNQYSQPKTYSRNSPCDKPAESATQTITIRFVEPPPKKRLTYSDSFKNYLETLYATNSNNSDGNSIPSNHNLPPTN